jgi:hypothetical protein
MVTATEVAAVLKALEAQAETRLFPAAVQVKVAPAAAFWKPAPQAVQTFAAAYDPVAQAAAQVVIVPVTPPPALAPTVFFEVAVAHDPVAKRVVVADAQVYVTALAAPVMAVQAVQVSVHVSRHAVDAHAFTTTKAAPSTGQVIVHDS